MKKLLSCLLLLLPLATCTDRTPIETEQKPTGPLVVQGAVLDGNGNAMAATRALVTILPAGCAGDPITAQEGITTTTDPKMYRALFNREMLPAAICVRASVELDPNTSDDNNTAQRDSIQTTTDSVVVNVAYDWSRVTARAQLMFYAQLPGDDLTVRLTLPAEEKTRHGTGSLPSLRVPGGTAVTVTGIVSSSDRSAMVSQTLTTLPDRTYGFDIIVSPKDPTLGCFGCMGKVSAPIRTSAGMATADSLFIIWGLNSITSPWIY